MAGKSNKGRNRKGSNTTAAATSAAAGPAPGNSLEPAVPSDVPSKESSGVVESTKAEANGVPVVEESADAKQEVKEPKTENSESQTKQGKIFFAVL